MGKAEWLEYEEKIIGILNKLEPQQMSQLLWLSVVRKFPDFLCAIHDDTSNRPAIRTYVNLLGISLGITYASFVPKLQENQMRGQSRDLEYAQAIIDKFVNSDYKLYFTRHASIYVTALSHARASSTKSGPFKNTSTRDIAVMLARYSDQEQFLHDIDCLQKNAWEGLDSSIYFNIEKDNDWDAFSAKMYRLKLGYWIRWYERVCKHNFIPENRWLQQIIAMPIEIIESDVNSSLKWLEELEQQGAKRLNEARIILLGEKGAGKTSIARRLIDPSANMPEERESTEGVDVSSFKLKSICPAIGEDQNANVHVWDFAGHSITHAAHRCFLSERCIYIILYDGRTEGRNRLDYWLNHVRDYGGDSKIYVLANIKDDNKPDIEENYIRKHYAKHHCEFFYFSIRDDLKRLEEFRFEIAQHIANDPAWSQNMPLSYFLAKEKLKTTFGADRDYITIDDFSRIAPEGNREMLKALHSLGICLHYEDIDEFRTLVLNPKWITWGIYHIINWLKNIQDNYQLTLNDFASIFSENAKKYPSDKYEFLYRLLIKYELAYEDNNKGVLIIPQCLYKDQPDEMHFPEFLAHARLSTRFDAKQKDDNTPMPFPPDIMPRIIVKRSAEASFSLSKVWRYGALLYLTEDTYAYIQQKDSVILLQVAGAERLQYHDILRGTILDTIHSYTSFQENEPDIKYELIEHPETMYPQKSLISLATKGLATFEDLGLDKIIDVSENARQYTIVIDNRTINISGGSPIISGGAVGSRESMDTSISYSFQYCNIVMKNRLEELAQLLDSAEIPEAKGLEYAAKMLNQADERKCKKDKSIRKSIQKIRDQLADEDSILHKTVKALVNGGKLIVDFLEAYNQFAKQCGWK